MKNTKIIIVFLLIIALFTKTGISSASDASRMATIESLVDYHSFIIDQSTFISTKDKYFYNGHFYSDKPPILSLYGSLFYFLLKHLFNLSLKKGEMSSELIYYLLTLLVVGISSCFGLFFLSKALKVLHIDEGWSNVVLLVTGLGTLILPYSTVFNNHTVSGSLLIISFYNLLKLDSGIKHIIFSGFFISLAGSIDITFFIFLFFAFIIIYNHINIKKIIIFIFSSMPMSLIYFWLNYYTSGSLIPPAMNKTLWDYPGSAFNETNLSGLVQNSSIIELFKYSYHMILGNKGLISYTPILLFSIFALIKIIFLKREPHKREYLFISLGSLAFVIFYVFRTNNYSGDSYGIRWFTSLMFIGCLPIAHLSNDIINNKIAKNIFIIIACISIFISFVGIVSPFTPLDYDGSSSFIACLILNKKASMWYKLNLFISMSFVYYLFYRLIKKSQFKLRTDNLKQGN
jgi:hypothetical protein